MQSDIGYDRGGIHTALQHGLAAGYAVADFLQGRVEDPCGWFVRSYPKFRVKRLLRFLFDHFQSDLAFNVLLAAQPMRSAASLVYFHRKGVFDPGGSRDARLPLEKRNRESPDRATNFGCDCRKGRSVHG